MKKLFLSLVLVALATLAQAQIPYFGNTLGEKGAVYGYAQFKALPQTGAMSFYCSGSVGVHKYVDLDANFNSGDMTLGLGCKVGYSVNKYFNIGLQPMVQFDLNNKFKPQYLNTGLFMNGSIGKGFWWVNNLWYWEYFNDRYVEDWLYLAYTYKWFTVTAGPTCEFVHDHKPDLAVGLWFNVYKTMYIYVQAGNMCLNAGNAKCTVGVDFRF
jgi:hypothetical protein